jgi:cytochrome P450
LKFDPERWRNVDLGKLPSYSYFPFSSGQRSCIGQHLAHLEAKITLIGLLKRYKSIKLEKSNFKYYERATYGPEPLKIFLNKD